MYTVLVRNIFGGENMTPLRAIRLKCLDCCCGQAREVRDCSCPDCGLYPYRLGKNPARAGLKNNGSFAKKHGSTDDSAREGDTEGKYIPSKRTATIFVGKKSGVEIRKEN